MKYLNPFAERLIEYLFTFLLFIFSSSLLFAQMDDPYTDHVPAKYFNLPNVYSPNAVVTVGDYDNFNMGYDYSEGHVSVNPRNPLWFFCAYNINGTHYSLNGWDWLINNPTIANAAGDPVTAYDSLGNLYYENMYGGITGCYVVKSTNNSQSWGPLVVAIAGSDKNWIAADQTAGPYTNYVYTTMRNPAATGISFSRSTNYGASFALMNTFTVSSVLPGAMVAVGPNGATQGGCVYVVTNSGPNSAGIYTFHKSTNGGANFSLVSTLSVSGYIGTEVSGRSCVGVMRTRPYPMIAADNSWGPYRGRLYLVWASNDPPGNGNKSDIWIKYSTDQGSTWSTTMRINDDASPTTNHSFFPAIWCEKETGKLYVNYYDTRLCPTSDSMDVYGTISTNGGQSFSPSQRLTNKTFKISLPGNVAPSYQGDYFSITANNKVGLAIWGDFRNASATSIGSFSAYLPDFGMRLSPAADSLNPNGSVTIQMQVPSVKLYTDTVIVSATITPAPATGTLTISYPSGNTLTSYPGSVPVRITAAGNATLGNYNLEVTAKGPNGTPIHKRTASIKVSSLVPLLSLNLTALLSGNYNGTTMVPKTVLVELHNSTTPYALVDSQTVQLNASGAGNPLFTKAVNGTAYYIVIKSNNTLETWSASPQTFSGSGLTYNFTTSASQAYGSNLIQVGTKWCIISGDADQDGSIGALDRSACWNDRNLSGNYATDLDGDGTVGALDRSIAWNNRNRTVQKPALAATPGVKQNNKVDNDKSKDTYDLKLDGSNARKVIKK